MALLLVSGELQMRQLELCRREVCVVWCGGVGWGAGKEWSAVQV